MTDPVFYLTMASAGLAGLGMVTMATLTGWRGWLQFKAREFDVRHADVGEPTATAGAGARIEIADLKERIRKLEAIAAGVDL